MRAFMGLSQLTGIIILLISLVFVLFAGFAAAVLRDDLSSSYTSTCKEDDAVYQEIVANHVAWLAYFSSASSTALSPHFTIEGTAQRFAVVPEFQYPARTLNLFYVPTAPGWPNRPQGSRGFIYSVNEEPMGEFWSDEYVLTQLGGNIFCYASK